MPRAGWAAVGGCIVGAAATTLDDSVLAAVVAASLALVLLVAGSMLRAARRTPCLAAVAGVLAIAGRLLLGAALGGSQPVVPIPEGSGPWTGTVASVGSAGGGVQRALVDLELGDAVTAKAWCTLPRYPEILPGDRVRLDGSIRAPGDDGFGAYLRRIGALGTIVSRHLERAPPAPGPAAWLEGTRRTAGELLASALPAPQAGLAAGILVGLRDEVDRGLAADFTTAGLSHVVAISGWNIAVVAGALAALLRPLARRPRSLATVAAIVAYTLAAGAGPSVVRAALMAGVVVLARESGRGGRAAAALALAALAMLLVDPRVALDAGFQLSVVATAGLLAWGTALTAWLRRHLPRGAPAWLIESLGVSLAAQAATLPLVLVDFGRLSLVAPLSNLVAAPLVVPVMLAAAASLGSAWLVSLGVPALAGAIVAVPCSLVIGALVWVVRLSASLPGASVTLESPWNWAAGALCAVGVAVAARPRLRRSLTASIRRACSVLRACIDGTAPRRQPGAPRRRPSQSTGPEVLSALPARPAGRPRRARRLDGRARLLAALVAVAVLSLGAVAASRPDGRLRVMVLDVGQGDAILLQSPHGARLLVDTGPDPDSLLGALDAAVPAWDRRLDAVVLTHPHDDHVGGMAVLVRRYAVGHVYENGMAGAGPGYAAYREALAARGLATGRLAAGDRLDMEGVAIQVLWPIPGTVPQAPSDEGRVVNDGSIVLDVRYGSRRFLLMADAEQDVDPRLLERGLAAGQRRVDVLKVAHHGSPTSSTAALLAAIRPCVALVSVGAGNTYGHPGKATLARLDAAGARTWRTDESGTVAVSTDGRDLVVDAARGADWRDDSAEPSPRMAAMTVAPRIAPRRTIGAGRSRVANRSRPAPAGADRQPEARIGRVRRPVGGVRGASPRDSGARAPPLRATAAPAGPGLPRITPWPSRLASKPRRFFSRSIRRPG